MEKVHAARRSAERFVEATLIVIFLLISISALGVALAYQWARVDLYQSTSTCLCSCTQTPCNNPCCQSKGTLYMGLFNLQVQKLTVGLTPLAMTDIYQTVGFNGSNINVSALAVVVAGSLASGLLSFICLFFAGINVWFSTKSVFYGPTVVYYLCFFSSIFSATALAAYLDFYIWILRDGVNLVPSNYIYLFDHRISDIQFATLNWAFYVHAAGAGCSVIAFALACRLAAVVLTVTRLPEKIVLPPGPLNVPYEVMASDLAKVAHGDADSLDEVEKEPHFSSHVQVESTETFEHEQETTVD